MAKEKASKVLVEFTHPTVQPRACAPSTITATAAPKDGAVVTEFRGGGKVLAGKGALGAFVGFHDFGGRNPI